MYITEEFEERKRSKTTKFENETVIPRFKDTAPTKPRKSRLTEHFENDAVDKLEEKDCQELLEDYQSNPYFRKKIDLIVGRILNKAEQPEQQSYDEHHLAAENLQTFNSKKREMRKSQKVKCEELRRQLHI